MDKSVEREQRQKKLANLFFEMGMDLDLIEKVSGVDKKELLKERIDNSKHPLTIDFYNSNIYLENNNSY